MSSAVLRTAWYRFRTTLARQWGGLLTVVLLVGLLGGLAMGAVAGARRTLASPAVFIASTDPIAFAVGTGIYPLTGPSGYDPALVGQIAHLPGVAGVGSAIGLNLVVMGPNGAPVKGDANPGNGSGSVDGAYFTRDKVSVVEGRMARADDPGEFVVNATAASFLHLHIGQVVPFGAFTNAQTNEPGFGTAAVPPTRRIDLTLVGIVVDPATVASDQVDTGTALQIFTPALTRQVVGCCSNYTESGVSVKGSGRAIARVEQEVERLLPKGAPVIVTPTTAESLTKAERVVKPLAIALGVFGGIAGLVALLVAGQVISRQLRFGADDRRVLRALGSAPVGTPLDGLLGLLTAVLAGCLLAVAVAVALSPLAPLGVIRAVYPDRGVAWDWTVLGLGFVVLAVGLGAMATVMAYQQSPHRLQRRGASPSSESHPAGLAARWGLPVPAVEGVRFALDRGAGRTSVPVRSAILGTVMALLVVVATVTFGSSLTTLINHPNLYGWNWDYVLSGGSGSGDIPAAQVTRLLDADRYVTAWSGTYFDVMKIDGQTVPVLGGTPGAPVQPPLLSGHGLAASDQVVLGTDTLAQLGKRVGESVVVDNGVGPPTRLSIVGTATMPTIGASGLLHPEMGSGALVPSALVPPAARNPFGDPQTGPVTIFVRLKHGASQQAAVVSLQRIASATSTPENFGVAVASVQKPAEIVNYRSLGATPLLLGGALAAGAAVALGLTLVASVRRRRRDLAVFKTLGFTHRQLAATVAWQSSVSVTIGILVGVPLGVVSGRWLWTLFATQINAVPAPSVPVAWVVAIAVGALVLANLVAAVPGAMAARTPTALVLRAD